jgi:DnaK suppressor protein
MAHKSEPAPSKRRAEVDDAGLNAKQRQSLRKQLVDEREQVRSRLIGHVSDATEDSDVSFADELDQATRHSEQAFLLRLADKERKLVLEIDRALSKFEHGTYGVCEGTGEPIGFKRLEARPWSRYSVEYKELLEKEQGRPQS